MLFNSFPPHSHYFSTPSDNENENANKTSIDQFIKKHIKKKHKPLPHYKRCAYNEKYIKNVAVYFVNNDNDDAKDYHPNKRKKLTMHDYTQANNEIIKPVHLQQDMLCAVHTDNDRATLDKN